MSDAMFNPEEYTAGRWLKGSDLEPGAQKVLTIKGGGTHTFEKTGETKPFLSFYEDARDVTVNGTQMKALVKMLGPDPKLWIGQRVAVMPVPSNFEGKPTIMYLPAPSQAPGSKAAGILPTDGDDTNGDVLFGKGKDKS